MKLEIKSYNESLCKNLIYMSVFFDDLKFVLFQRENLKFIVYASLC